MMDVKVIATVTTYALFVLTHDVTTVMSQFAVEPVDTAVVESESVKLRCKINELPLSDTLRWYRYVDKPLEPEELWDGLENRFVIGGNRNIGEYDLLIHSTQTTDSGLYTCGYGAVTTSNATLIILPTSWLPVCRKFPINEPSVAGDSIEITCSSVGSLSTELLWLSNDASAIVWRTSRNGTALTITHEAAISRDGALSFTCEASVPGLESARRCILGPFPENGDSSMNAFIPFIVVGLLSVVVVLLFLIVIFILFRHRQCRFCKRELPQPQMVVDANAIASGRGFPTIIFDDDDAPSDGLAEGVDNSALSDNQPDVVSYIYAGAGVSQKSPNSTLRDNMEKGKRGIIPAKHSEIEKFKPSEIRKLKKASLSGSSHVENVNLPSASHDFHTPSPQSGELNVTTRSATGTPTVNEVDRDQPETSFDLPSAQINDLDASHGRKNRFTKRRDSKKSASSITQSTSPNNMTDSVIYAELDFSKNLGMNILGDE